MAITVDFYTNKSDNRCLTKVLEPTQDGQNLSCDIYDPCDRLQHWTKTFYPMIRRAEITDNTFQPYAPTNRELYEMILAMQGGTS